MAGLEQVSASKCFDGVQAVYRHDSAETKTPMRFGVYHPPQRKDGPVPVVWWLSGLTCTEENFIVKAGAQRVAAEFGLMLIVPDTSPRGPGVPDDPEGAYDLGIGAGFYVDATEPPWAETYRMYAYVVHELPQLVGARFADADLSRQSVMGHSMGGHGALIVALKNPGRFRAVSALAPIVSPMNCGWGQKAFANYLGPDRAAWRRWDACALIEDGARVSELLVDQGTADPYLEKELKPELLERACASAGVPLKLRRHDGYDHGYFFVSSFIEDHLRWHAERFRAAQAPAVAEPTAPVGLD